MSSASACTAPVSPRSASTGGWMPRTTERRSASAASWSSRASLTSLRAAPGPSSKIWSAMPGSSPARPAGPARRRAGRARPGGARRPRSRQRSARDSASVCDAPLQRLGARRGRAATGRARARARTSGDGEPPDPPGDDRPSSSTTARSDSTNPNVIDTREPEPGPARSSGRRPPCAACAARTGRRRGGTAPASAVPSTLPAIRRCAVGQPRAAARQQQEQRRRPRPPSARRRPRQNTNSTIERARRAPAAAGGVAGQLQPAERAGRAVVVTHRPSSPTAATRSVVQAHHGRGASAPDLRGPRSRAGAVPYTTSSRRTVMSEQPSASVSRARGALERHPPVARDRRLAGLRGRAPSALAAPSPPSRRPTPTTGSASPAGPTRSITRRRPGRARPPRRC